MTIDELENEIEQTTRHVDIYIHNSKRNYNLEVKIKNLPMSNDQKELDKTIN